MYGNKRAKKALLKYNETNIPYYIYVCHGAYADMGTRAYGRESSVYRLASASLWCGGRYAYAGYGVG